MYADTARADHDPGTAETPAAVGEKRAEHDRLVAEITSLRAQLAALNRDNESLEAFASLATLQARYQTLFESGTIGVFAGDLGGFITEANDAFLRLIGYSREYIEAGRLSWEDLLPGDDPDLSARVAQGIAAVQSSRVIQPVQSRFVHRDGHIIDVLVGGALFENSTSRGYCFVLDLTARHQAQRALEESEQRFKSLFDYNPDGIVAVDREGRFTVVNPAGERILGYTREELLAQPFQPLLAPEAVAKAERTFLGSLAGESLIEELAVFTRDGTRVEVNVTSVPIFVDGEVVGIYGILQDITERKRAEAALRASEERYRAFVSQSTEAIWRFEFGSPPLAAMPEDELIDVIFNQAVLAECNDLMARMYGYDSAEEIIGRTAGHFLPQTPENTEWLRSWIRNGFRLVEAESEEQDRQGHTRYFSNSFVGVLQDGRLLRAWGTQRDVTERRQTEVAQEILAEAGAIFASSLDYQITLQNVAGLIVPRLADLCLVDIVDDEGECQRLMVVAAKGSHQAVIDYMQGNCLLSSGLEFGPAHVARTGEATFVPRFTEVALEEVARDPEALEILRLLDCKSYVCVPMAAGGRILGAISFVSATSNRIYAEAELPLMRAIADRAALSLDNARLYQQAEEARREAERANRTKDEFLAVVSHELRTPLTPMLGWLDLMKTGSLTPERLQSAVDAIERNARMQMQLVNDLLDVSRIISGNLRLEKNRLNLRKLVELTAEMVRPSTLSRGIELECELHDVGEVVGDPNRLQQIIWNLLANATKFTPEQGRIELTLERWTKPAGGPEAGAASYARIRVRDNGIGIAPDFLPHVFERFSQADSSTTRRQGGLGLGLSIVRHLVEKHGGEVSAHSEGIGKGAEFVVSLPLATQADRDTALIDPAEHAPPALAPIVSLRIELAPGGPATSPPLRLLDGLRILVVDDEADARDFLRESFGLQGASVRTAGSAREALEILGEWVPAVIVSDIGMAEVDGYDFIRQVRALPGILASLPAIALTAYARSQDRTAALEAGYDIHFSKPANTRILFNAIAQLATKQRSTRAGE